MTLVQKAGWTRSSDEHLSGLRKTEQVIASGQGEKFDYYTLPGIAFCYAMCAYVEGDYKKAVSASELLVSSTLEYFYGDWRRKLAAPSGRVDPDEWRRTCLWFEVVAESLPWAAALGDWKAVRKIAEYPIDEAFPEAWKAKGETAWTRALVCFLRNEPRKNVEAYLMKAEAGNAKRPKLLVPILKAMLDNEEGSFENAFYQYLEFYRKREFKVELDKLVSLEGTTLYHIGRNRGFEIDLPANTADHIIRLMHRTR